MYTQNKPISAMIVLVLLLIVFLFFGQRWFQYGQLKGSSGWMQANALAQSGSSSSGQCSDGSGIATSSAPTSWPPVVNQCPDFMTLASTGCVDTHKLYGTTAIGTLTFSNTLPVSSTAAAGICSVMTPAKSAYLRWEGVVQQEGNCISANIGKPPSL